EELLGGAVGAAVVAEVVGGGDVKDERPLAPVVVGEADAAWRAVPGRLVRVAVSGTGVGVERAHLDDVPARTQVRAGARERRVGLGGARLLSGRHVHVHLRHARKCQRSANAGGAVPHTRQMTSSRRGVASAAIVGGPRRSTSWGWPDAPMTSRS